MELFENVIPNEGRISIYEKILRNQCSIDPKIFDEYIHILKSKLYKELNQLCDGEIQEEDISLDFSINPISFKRTLTLADTSLVSILNYSLFGNLINFSEGMDKKEFDKICRKKLIQLKKIRTESEFKKEFPELYENYLVQKNLIETYNYNIKMLQFLRSNKYSDKAKAEIGKVEMENKKILDTLLFYKIDIKNWNFLKYKERMSAKLKNLVENHDKEYDRLSKIELDTALMPVDTKKAEMLLAYSALIDINICLKMPELQQELLYYVTSYIKENKQNLDDGITLDFTHEEYLPEEYQKVISKRDIYNLYLNTILKFQDLRIINLPKETFEGMSMEEVKKYMENHKKEYKSQYKIFEGTNDELFKDTIVKLNNKIQETNSKDEAVKYQNLIKMYIKKKEFLDSLVSIRKIRGTENYSKYIVFLFRNGKVLVDKLYENEETKTIAYGSAMFILDFDDFEELFQYSPSQLREDPRVTRIVHFDGFDEKANSIIYADNNEDYTEKILAKFPESK